MERKEAMDFMIKLLKKDLIYLLPPDSRLQ